MNYEPNNHYKKTIMEDEVVTNESLPKNHPHYSMRHHHAWQGVVFPCKKCKMMIEKTDSGLCAKCSHVKHKPLKRLTKKK